VLPIRFILFMLVGLSGVAVQIISVKMLLWLANLEFVWAQTIAVVIAMTTNYILNNLLTYRDRALRGAAFFRGLLSFYVVCSVGAVANVAVADWAFALVPIVSFASFVGAVMGALWNFIASSLFTWRAR
jgi:dolichol-phosphate mannosyltransferase